MKHAQIVALNLPAPPVAADAEAALRRSLWDAPIPAMLMDTDLQPVLANRAWQAEQVTPDALDGGQLASVLLGDDFLDAARRCRKTLAVQACQIEVQPDADHPRRWFALDVGPWPLDGSPVTRIVVLARETTDVVLAHRETEEARRQMAEQNARFEAALVNMPHGLCMFDADKRMILCNAAYGRLYGLPEELMQPGTPLDRILDHRASTGSGPRSYAAFYAATVDAALRGSAATRDVELTDGRTIRITHNPIKTGGYVATHEDVSESVRATAQIEFLAFRDTLTGLPNRAAFQRAYEDAIAAAERDGELFGVIMVDVDHFKQVNDTFGHDAGDALLQALATQLKRVFRRGDTVARLGGDEFAVLVRDVAGDVHVARPIAALRDLLRTPIIHAGQSFTISASIGVAVHADLDADPSHILKNADVALYKAKTDGRNRSVTFEPAMRTEVEQRVELLREVRLAVAQGEFCMFYQPVVDLGSRTVVAFEALMRWNHPDQGILPPAAFMAALDDSELGLQLGDVALDQTLGQMRAWLDAGVEFGRVAVNVSSGQFRSGRLASEVAAKLAHWNVPAERLTIEVTENVYIGWGAEVVSQTVRELHESGVMIALDDFGTGYASLANLRQFPIDRLKIDKSFVQNTEDDAIVRAVINLGSSMGMKVVAEGVERAEQVDTLIAYGCDQVQGYHFAKPMPASEVSAFVRSFGGRD